MTYPTTPTSAVGELDDLSDVDLTGGLSDDNILQYNSGTGNFEPVDGTSLGVTDHGLLDGLADDDHTQYVLVDGTRPMSLGDYSFNISRNVTSVQATLQLTNVLDSSPVSLLLTGDGDAASIFLQPAATSFLNITGPGMVTTPSYSLYEDGNHRFESSGTFVHWIEADGTISVQLVSGNYEDLVTADDDIPNKKYVDDAITAGVETANELAELTDVDLTGSPLPATGDILKYNSVSSKWEHGQQTAEVNDLTAVVTWANIPDVNVPQSAVTQHQAAISITESQISDLSHATDFVSAASGGTFSGDITITDVTPILTINGTSNSASHLVFERDGVQKRYIQNDATDKFIVSDSSAINAAFTIESDETLTVGDTVNYETLVTADDDIPNKKYVDDAITTGTSGLIDSTGVTYENLDTNGDVGYVI